ncbi:MAG: aminoacyl-histidine dipeptidase [Chlorobi bacterium]|nr:aminoacyl-histidine dipeptidase [Chlorobiota bacterium]
MHARIARLDPEPVWRNFVAFNAVPRPSKKEEKALAYVEEFGKRLGLETFRDKGGNVIIRKPATPGMENRETVILQAHVDMVPQKEKGVDHDFEKEGIKMKIDGDWVTAEGTTLGADNGIGVAAILALLESKDIPHPPLEALFTYDEETGMTGAKKLEEGVLRGKIMLNLDTENDDELDIGCAGGIDVTARGTYQETEVPQDSEAWQITVKGLTGGHSGMDIHLYRGNANKIMNSLLHKVLEEGGHIARVEGGGLRNAIPRESEAVIILPASEARRILEELRALAADIAREQAVRDPGLQIEFSPASRPARMMAPADARKLVQAVYGAHNGVYRMNPAIEGQVETSNNVASVRAAGGEIEIGNLTRSSSESAKQDLVNALKSVFELAGYRVTTSGDYPGWEPDPDSRILDLMKNLYVELYRREPRVEACHAGLECGIVKNKYPDLDVISFGPTIWGAHSPDERVHIGSVKKFWDYLLETLKRVPERQEAPAE